MIIRLLMVDDHEAYLERMQRLFAEESDIEVVGVATNGKEAVRLAKKLLPDLVLMDISMPVLNGIDAAKRIMKKTPLTRILCLTVHGEKHFVLAMFRAGVIGYVLKETPFEELIKAIHDVHAGKRYLSSQIACFEEEIVQAQTKRVRK
jgi:DNA-binding NarL/FixJ family response regulator